MWKGGYRCAATLSVDFDAESLWSGTFKLATPSPLSRGDYDVRAALPRIHALLDAHELPATFMVPGQVAEEHTEACAEIAARGRQEIGFAYDSSLFGHDEPYRPRVPIAGGPLRDFVELPVSWELDDAPYFLFSFFPYMSGLSTPSQVLEIWKAEFDGSYRVGGCFLLVVHPFCIGRHPRIAMLDELLSYIKGHDDVWFATHLDAAEEWRRLQIGQGLWEPATPG